METIFALASAQGKAGVAVIRISGPKADDVLRTLGGRVPKARVASLQRLKDPSGDALDEVLVLAFDEGASFTGERVIELHTHGSVAVVNCLLDIMSQVPDVTLAEPGEFTRRALMNGRLDLAQVEGLADLIDAETESQRRQAVRLFDGGLSVKAENWRVKLVEARALLEAAIDFADEEVPVDVSPDVNRIISELLSAWQFEFDGYGASERTRVGFEIALVGRPNAGKSTLLNALAGRDAAITSSVAGTTRDVIEVRMDVDGLPVTFLDTAGLRETSDSVEAIGVSRTRQRAEQADMRVFLCDIEDEVDKDLFRDDDIVVICKADVKGNPAGGVSGKTGYGVYGLVQQVSEVFQNRVSGSADIVNRRQKMALQDAVIHLENARSLLKGGPDEYDLASEEVRLSHQAVRSLLGDVGIEDVYDQIFSRFCIGK